MQDFIKAVEDDETTEEELEDGTSFEHWGTPVTFYQPSDGQMLMMLAMYSRSMSDDAAGRFVQLFLELGDRDTKQYFEDLMMDRRSGFDLKSSGGLFDVWDNLQKEWTGKKSKKPSGSPKSASATGAGSTGTSRRRASASSRSRSTAS
jgi:hypothetical protein